MSFCQDAYLGDLAAFSMEYDVGSRDAFERIVALSQGTPKGQRGRDWILQMREAQRDLRTVMRRRDHQEFDWEDCLRRTSLELCREFSDLEDLMVWSDSSLSAMERSAERESLNDELERKQRAAWSQEDANRWYASRADQRYREWFAKASGRPAHRGHVGASEPIYPELPAGWRNMSNVAFAYQFLQLGGYSRAMQTDEQGWTALHYACQATVFWDIAHRVCYGLIEMMDATSRGLNATTWGGRPIGYSALHFAANGSDSSLERGNLVRRLIAAEADVDARDAKGRTPFLHACGTGVVDVAQALSQAGCDIHVCSWDGRNGADRCQYSSGSMLR